MPQKETKQKSISQNVFGLGLHSQTQFVANYFV